MPSGSWRKRTPVTGWRFATPNRPWPNQARRAYPGDETFYEHVHFNFDGNYRLGKMWAEQIGQQLAARRKSARHHELGIAG